MKILYVVADPGQTRQSRGGGFQTHVRETIENFQALGHQVELLDSGQVELEADGRPRAAAATHSWKERLPQPVRAVGRDALYVLHNRKFLPQLEAFAAAHGPFDAVYERYHAFEFAPGEWARRTRLPWVLEFNASVDELQILGGLGLGCVGRAIERRVVAGANHVVAVSDVLRRQLLRLGVEPRRAHVLHNAVDPGRFHPGIPGSQVRRRLGLEGRIAIGFVGSFAPYHGVELFLAAARRVARERPEVVFVLVGGRKGLRRYEELRAATEASVPGGAVRFLGEVPHAEIPSCLAAMDVAVIPMAADYGSPTKTFEYMAMGKAVVAPAVPALKEVLTDRRTALLTRPGDWYDLSCACLELASDGELRRSLGQAAREAVVARHTWSLNARFLLDLLEDARREGSR